MFLGNVITLAYKSTLLSSLVQIRYERPIDTLSDLHDSSLPALIAGSSPFTQAFATDPRKTMQDIFKRSIVYPYNGTVPKEIKQM